MIILGMLIDEARRYYMTSNVDYFFSVGLLQVTDGGNAIGRDRNIPGKRFGAGAIDDAPSADE